MQVNEWKPAESVRFWFARHGQSEYNLEDRIGGDSSITPLGQTFADALPALFGRVLLEVCTSQLRIPIYRSIYTICITKDHKGSLSSQRKQEPFFLSEVK